MKTVLVTGAAGGMGQAVCRRLRQKGYQVFGLDIRPAESSGEEIICCDVTDTDSVLRAKEQIASRIDHLDAIVHTAGIYDLDSLAEIDEARFTRIFQINVFGVYRVNRALLPMMGAGGRVVVITSELAPLNPLPFTGLYAVTKSALDKYAFSLRSELMLRDISVTVIRPGAVSTGLLGTSASALEKFCAGTAYYRPNAANFKKIVDSVEARSVPPERVADLVEKALTKRHPRYVYTCNRNPLLLMMSALPDHLQYWILRQILK